MSNRPKVGIGVVLFNEQNEMLLGKRIGSHGESAWANPGGHLEFGESFEQCAIREVLEETGVRIKSPKFLAVTNDVFVQENRHYISIFMQAFCSSEQAIKNCEPHKTEYWQWFDLENLPENLFLSLRNLCEQDVFSQLIKSHA